MSGHARAAVKRLAHLAGFEISSVGDGVTLVQRRSHDPQVAAEQLDERTWFVQPSGTGGRRGRRVGGKTLGVHVLVGDETTREHMPRFQRAMSQYLATEQVAATLHALDVNCVLDVGANKGQFARSLRRSGYTGRIVSFEPLAEFAAAIREVSAADPDWLLHECALGDEDGEAEINAMPGTMSSLLPASDFGREWAEKLRDTHVETITIRRLEGLFDELVEGLSDPRVYLKLDTQGFDLRAFRGAGAAIDRVVGMQSELSCLPIYVGMPRWSEQLTAYEEAGFEIVGLYEVSRDAPTMRVIEFDVVMVRPEHVRRDRG